MRTILASELIEISERGARLGNASRALLLLEAGGEIDAQDAAALPLGARDRLLLRLRAALFGERMVAQQQCAACGENYELSLCAADVGLGDLPTSATAPCLHLDDDGTPYRVRALTAGDMVAAEAAPDVAAALTMLLRRAAPDAPGDAVTAARISETVEALDPDAEVLLSARCPACGHGVEHALDVPAFVWREIEQRVPRILREVADLARLYHWSERDILAMPAARRRFYLSV